LTASSVVNTNEGEERMKDYIKIGENGFDVSAIFSANKYLVSYPWKLKCL
jgi:hypothetical protein